MSRNEKNMKMNREELKKFLPHREPMLLVDESEMIGDYVYSKYHVTGDEFFLKGHFPGKPVVPGVILCEIMAQASTLLVTEALIGKVPLYAGITKAKFKRIVVPGDDIHIKAHLTGKRESAFFVEAEAYVNDEMCCNGQMSFILIDEQETQD